MIWWGDHKNSHSRPTVLKILKIQVKGEWDNIERSKKYQPSFNNNKKRKLLQEKLPEYTGIPQEVWKIKKKKSLTDKKAPTTSMCLSM